MNLTGFYNCFVFFLLFFLFAGCLDQGNKAATNSAINTEGIEEGEIKSTWAECGLKDKLDYNVFNAAYTGYSRISGSNKNDTLIIVDYSLPSTDKRFYVIDLKNKKLLHHTLVAHGRNSGNNRAGSFSNKPGSKASSLGFYKTAETYYGKHGYSLRLDGLEKGINHNARKRAIVIHGAGYVSHQFIKKHGRLGRSWGCPALPDNLSEQIIKTIAKGKILFVYGKDENYRKESLFFE